MASRAQNASVDDLLSGIVDRIEGGLRLPNIFRYTPLPQQDLFHQSTAKGRILFGGNRGGKTYGGISDDVMILLRRHEPRNHLYPPAGHPLRMRFIGVDFDRGIDQTAIPLFAQLIPGSFLINGSWEDSYDRTRHMLTLADKSTVSFMSYEQKPDKFQAVSLHHIHFDEEPPKAIFDESMLRLLDTAGSWTLSETPVQQLEWVQDDLVEPAEAGMRTDIEVFRMATTENTNLDPQEILDLMATMTEEEKTVRIFGGYLEGSLVFPEFKQKAPFVIPEDDFTLDREWAIYESMDYGYANPNAWLWTAVHEDGRIITFRELYAPRIIVETWAQMVFAMRKQIEADFGIHYDDLFRGVIGDPSISNSTGAGQTGLTIQQAYALHGINIATEGIVKARTGNPDVGLNKMHTYLKPRPAHHEDLPGVPWWQMLDTCPNLASEMRRARKPKQTRANKEVKNTSEQIRDKDNHAIDAQKYLFMRAHDLRPEGFREIDDALMREMGEQLHATSSYRNVADVYAGRVSSTPTHWRSVGSPSDGYFSLEE